MKSLKAIFVSITMLAFMLIMPACQKGAMEEQTGSGTDTSDTDYTEFAAKGIAAKEAPAKEVFTFTIKMAGNGEGKVIVDDGSVCFSSDGLCVIAHNGPSVKLEAKYDEGERFEGFGGVVCPPSDICSFMLSNDETVVTATFEKR